MKNSKGSYSVGVGVLVGSGCGEGAIKLRYFSRNLVIRSDKYVYGRVDRMGDKEYKRGDREHFK